MRRRQVVGAAQVAHEREHVTRAARGLDHLPLFAAALDDAQGPSAGRLAAQRHEQRVAVGRTRRVLDAREHERAGLLAGVEPDGVPDHGGGDPARLGPEPALPGKEAGEGTGEPLLEGGLPAVGGVFGVHEGFLRAARVRGYRCGHVPARLAAGTPGRRARDASTRRGRTSPPGASRGTGARAAGARRGRRRCRSRWPRPA